MLFIPRSEFPRPDFERAEWLNLNGEWDFELFETADGERSYPDKITVPFSWAAPLSGFSKNVPGIGWYRRTAEFKARGRVFLIIGAADYITDLYINGAHAGHHQGGYTQFETDVTELWREGANTIEIRCEDFRRKGQTYGKQGYGDIQGIWQTVWLEDRPEARIENFKIAAKIDGSVKIDVSATAPEGSAVCAYFDGQKFASVVSGGHASISFKLSSPRLWSCEDPYLYEGAISVGADYVKTYFGVREIGAAKFCGRDFKWITLNGKPVYINGTLDQAFNPKGHFTYPTDADARREAERLKELGLNMVRIHIKSEEPRKLYWMDKLGVLVMEDIPCFWGEPTETARAAYENEWPEMIRRDINHPSIFAWVMFNEDWGLRTKVEDKAVYLPETQAWVESVWARAKEMDDTRLVEDNSVCNYDHTSTDINTWHFYINGYELVRDHIGDFVKAAHPGSEYNFVPGKCQTDAPVMNSECGMVWGVDESAGDSDIAWQYHYMLNEYRLHEKMCGFVFTELHDVVNEFNGYFRIDDTRKDFGYEAFVPGMTIRDMHAADFAAIDHADCETIAAGGKASARLVLSSFTDERHEAGVTVKWELWHEGINGRTSDAVGEIAVPRFSWGATELGDIDFTMPGEDAVAVLSVWVIDALGRVVSRNFTTFDVRGDARETVKISDVKYEGFSNAWTALSGSKLCLGGSGSAKFNLSARAGKKSLVLEAGAKRVLKKDAGEHAGANDGNFMLGYLVDRGSFKNSYWMTDETLFKTDVEIFANGEKIGEIHPANDWADARGVISWKYQTKVRALDEAGSYGEKFVIALPEELAGEVEIELRVRGGGLALYGRDSGRYPFGITLV